MIDDNSYLLAIINKTFNVIKYLSTFGIFLAKTGGHCRRAHLAAAPAARLSTKERNVYLVELEALIYLAYRLMM